MKRLLVAAGLLASLAGCIDFRAALQECEANAKCRTIDDGGLIAEADGGVGGGGGGGTGGGAGDAGEDAGQGGDAGSADAGPCPDTRSMCRGGWCWEAPAFPTSFIRDVFADDRALWAVGERGYLGCYDGVSWSFDFSSGAEWHGVHGSGGRVALVGQNGLLRIYDYATRAWFDGGGPSELASSTIHDVWTDGDFMVLASAPLCEGAPGSWDCSLDPIQAVAVSGTSRFNVVAVGADTAPRLSYRRDAGWTPATATSLADVEYTAACVFPAGRAVAGGKMELTDRDPFVGTMDLSLASPSWTEKRLDEDEIYDVACLSDGGVLMILDGDLACGDGGACLRTGIPSDTHLLALHEGPRGLVAAGLAGEVFERGATGAWTVRTALRAPALFGVAIAPDGGAWAVGESCLVKRRGADGSWSSEQLGMCADQRLADLHFAPTGDAYIVGLDFIWRVAAGQNPSTPVFSQVVGNWTQIGGSGAHLWASGPDDRVLRLEALGGNQWEQIAVPASTATDPGYNQLWVQPDGGAVIADYDRVRWITADGGSVWSVTKSSGYNIDALSGFADGEPIVFAGNAWYRASAGQGVLSPLSVANVAGPPHPYDACGDGSAIWVSDSSGRVARVSPVGGSAGQVTAVDLPSPAGGLSLFGIGCGPSLVTAVGEYGTIVTGPR